MRTPADDNPHLSRYKIASSYRTLQLLKWQSREDSMPDVYANLLRQARRYLRVCKLDAGYP